MFFGLHKIVSTPLNIIPSTNLMKIYSQKTHENDKRRQLLKLQESNLKLVLTLYDINYFNKTHNINYSGPDLLNILFHVGLGSGLRCFCTVVY